MPSVKFRIILAVYSSFTAPIREYMSDIRLIVYYTFPNEEMLSPLLLRT